MTKPTGLNQNFDTFEVVAFSDTAPDWRILSEGLNVESVCNTNREDCAASGKRVWTDFTGRKTNRFGDINLISRIDAIACPICKRSVKIEDICGIGFYNCSFIIEGKLAPSEKEVTDKQLQETPRFESKEFFSQKEVERKISTPGFVKYEKTSKVFWWLYANIDVQKVNI